MDVVCARHIERSEDRIKELVLAFQSQRWKTGLGIIPAEPPQGYQPELGSFLGFVSLEGRVFPHLTLSKVQDLIFLSPLELIVCISCNLKITLAKCMGTFRFI